jgi:hypothetical protein
MFLATASFILIPCHLRFVNQDGTGVRLTKVFVQKQEEGAQAPSSRVLTTFRQLSTCPSQCPHRPRRSWSWS